jgi:hypothetical protein
MLVSTFTSMRNVSHRHAAVPRIQSVGAEITHGGGNQLWRLEPVPGDGVRIVNGQSGMCLDIPFGTSEPHVAVEQFPINGGSNQGWRLEHVGNHWYRIVNQWTGLCPDVGSRSSERRAAIEQAVRSDSPFQHWRMIAVRRTGNGRAAGTPANDSRSVNSRDRGPYRPTPGLRAMSTGRLDFDLPLTWARRKCPRRPYPGP